MKQFFNIKIMFLAVCFLHFHKIHSQDDAGGSGDTPIASNLVQVPNSPEAEAIMRFGNVPISYYTGKPNVTVPIHTIQGRELSVPISLSYDASGIKVQSISSKVGAGWNLNAGGMVVREVVGLPDSAVSQNVYSGNVKSLNYYLNSLRGPEHNNYINFESYSHTISNINKFRNAKADQSIGEADLLPDIFHFNAPGLSGSIVIDPNTDEAYSINDPDIKVTYVSSFGNEISSWIITNASGNTYYFSRAEETTSTFSSEANEGTRIYNSGWYLTKIISANHKDEFDFLYLNPQYWDQPQNYYNGQTSQADLTKCNDYTQSYDPTDHVFNKQSQESDYKIEQSTLYAIEHNDEIIATFFNTTDRLDLEGQKRLDKISISSLKIIDFEYSYFTTESTPNDETDYRLRLDGIKMTPLAQGSSGPVLLTQDDINGRDKNYAFHYNTDHLPSRRSLSQDALGYYNGAGNSTLIPQYTHYPDFWVFSGADRNSDFAFKQKGVLTKIDYPTGGSTEFTYKSERLPDSHEEYLKESFQSLGSIGSGEDPNATENDFDCDDGFWYFPKTSTTSFTVEDYEKYSNDTRYVLTANKDSDGEYSQSGRVFFMAIYKDREAVSTKVEGEDYIMLSNGCIEILSVAEYLSEPLIVCPSECETVYLTLEGRDDLEPFPFTVCYDNYLGIAETANKTFCELNDMILNGHEDVVYYSYGGPTSGSAPLSFGLYPQLPPGNYKTFMMNSRLGVSYSFKRSYLENDYITIQNWSSDLRLDRIIDKTNEGETYIKELDFLTQNKKQYIKLNSVNVIRDNTDGDCYATGDGTYKTLHRYTTNQYAKTPHEYTFSKVRETILDSGENVLGSTVYEFYDQEFYTLNPGAPYGIPTAYNPEIGVPFIPNNPLNGQSKQTTYYDKDGNILKQEASFYNFENSLVTSGTNFYSDQTILDSCTMAVPSSTNTGRYTIFYSDSSSSTSKTCVSSNGNLALGGFGVETPYSDTHIQYNSFKTQLLETTSKEYFYDVNGAVDSISNKSTYVYGNEHNLPLEITQEVNNGKVITTVSKYPKDIESPSEAEQKLIDENHINIPIEVEKVVTNNTNNNVLATEKKHTEYHQWNDDVILPIQISTSINNEDLEERVTYHSYNDSGNPTEISQVNGSHSIYIWGYNEQYPIAKIDNATYENMPASVVTLIENIKTKSNDENFEAEETELIDLFEGLRTNAYFANSMLTTYTYDPLVGVTSITDPKGYTTYYEYDGFQRLLAVRDAEGNLLSTNEYNYKN